MTNPAMPTADELVTHTLRKNVADLLNECTDKQRAFFGRLYPQGIDALNDDKLRCAYDQCRRSIEKNRKGREQ